LWAPQIGNAESFMDYMQGVLALISPPVVAVFVAGLFFRKATPDAAFAALISGFLIGIFMVVVSIFDVPSINNIPFLIKAPIIFSICTFIVIVVSMFTKERPYSEIESIVWKKSIYTTETIEMKGLAWYNNYRILSVILIVITFVLVFLFR
jgi:SSS family solute:Na+ symporter